MNAGSHHPATRLLCCALSCIVAIGAVQLSGCNRSQSKTGAAKVKEKKPLPPFEPLRVFVEPNERSSFNPGPKDSARIVNVLKPGHWSGILLQTQANTKEFTGTLSSAPQNAQRRPLELEQSPYWVSTMRRVTLPKGQQKQFESLFFAPRPRPESTTKASTWIANRLSGSGQGLQAQPEPVLHMPSYQYHMVVLAPQPARYRYLNGLSCVRPRTNAALISPLDRAYYRVEFPPVDAPLALPSHPLCWTSIAYIVWDDVLPDALTPEQQQAMVDWLHWGGALIVSGPDSLDKLAGSFLADYLPAKVGSSGPLQADKLAELHDAWRVRGDGSESLAAREGRTWSGVELVKHTEATAVPNTAELIVERRIGRGRVLVTAFRLAEPELAGWRSFDSMFNACILGRPPRLHAEIGDRFAYRGSREHDAFDARLSSGVRFFSRDVPDANVKSRNEITDALDDASAMRFQGVTDLEFQTQIAESKLIDELKANAGVAGWNDFSPVASAARATLRDAAGISVPKRSFVLKMIGLYLIVVVPVNWLVFRLLGRIEWAWVAVPVVALVWGVVVVWAAQLDIGFARAETEVSVLEMQPGYPRGHLTRYTALYSSLSTGYELGFDDPSALALPFATEVSLANVSSREVTFTALGDHELDGYNVPSNSTGMVHSEQMCELGGEIEWDAPPDMVPSLINGTQWKLSGAVVLSRRPATRGEPTYKMALLGDLEPGAKVDVSLVSYDKQRLADYRAANPRTAKSANGELSLAHLLALAEDIESLEPGDVRLVAWHDGRLDGIRVQPSSSQSRAATLAVAHLVHASRTTPQRDVNLRPQRPEDDLFFEAAEPASAP